MRHLKAYLPALLMALVLGLTVATVAAYVAGTDSPTAYEPLKIKELRFEESGPFAVGQEVTLHNGICNQSNEILQVITIVGFEEQGMDKLIARNITVSPARAELGGTPLPRPIEPGCIAEKPVLGKLPPTLPPGRWKLYVNMTIMGPQSGQVQRITATSQEITVVP